MFIRTALYISFTAVGSEAIAGVQSRYLTPLVFPLLYFIGSSKMINKMYEQIYTIVMLGIPTFILMQGIWQLCIKGYY